MMSSWDGRNLAREAVSHALCREQCACAVRPVTSVLFGIGRAEKFSISFVIFGKYQNTFIEGHSEEYIYMYVVRGLVTRRLATIGLENY